MIEIRPEKYIKVKLDETKINQDFGILFHEDGDNMSFFAAPVSKNLLIQLQELADAYKSYCKMARLAQFNTQSELFDSWAFVLAQSIKKERPTWTVVWEQMNGQSTYVL